MSPSRAAPAPSARHLDASFSESKQHRLREESATRNFAHSKRRGFAEQLLDAGLYLTAIGYAAYTTWEALDDIHPPTATTTQPVQRRRKHQSHRSHRSSPRSRSHRRRHTSSSISSSLSACDSTMSPPPHRPLHAPFIDTTSPVLVRKYCPYAFPIPAFIPYEHCDTARQDCDVEYQAGTAECGDGIATMEDEETREMGQRLKILLENGKDALTTRWEAELLEGESMSESCTLKEADAEDGSSKRLQSNCERMGEEDTRVGRSMDLVCPEVISDRGDALDGLIERVELGKRNWWE